MLGAPHIRSCAIRGRQRQETWSQLSWGDQSEDEAAGVPRTCLPQQMSRLLGHDESQDAAAVVPLTCLPHQIPELPAQNPGKPCMV